MSLVEVDGTGTARRYSANEVRTALSSLSAADLVRIERVSRHFAPRTGLLAEDLRQEAYARALGSRTCAVGTSMVEFLAGIMKSLASERPRRKRKLQEEGGFELVYEAELGDGAMPEPESLGPSPEDEVLSRVMHRRELEKALACIEGDEDLQLLVEGLFDGLFGKDLEELLGTDTKGLAAARKRLARRLRVKFPEGTTA